MLFAACSPTQQPADPASTVVNPDGTVTFNYRNDNAKNVEVSVQFAGSHAMAKDSVLGLWTLTLGPAAPDIYPYCFVVDGVSVMDPQNSQYFPNEGFKKSLLDIPGKDNPLIHAYQSQNPQGKVDYVTYYSSTIGCYNNALIYTPASYNPDDNKRYPVFYLISGTTDTEEVYYKVGRMNTIIDNLIAEGKAEEMIIVLPYGNPVKLMDQPADFAMDLFSKDLINDLMPYVEANYLTINDAEHRAIGGFSRGGNQALSNGLMNLASSLIFALTVRSPLPNCHTSMTMPKRPTARSTSFGSASAPTIFSTRPATTTSSSSARKASTTCSNSLRANSDIHG